MSDDTQLILSKLANLENKFDNLHIKIDSVEHRLDQKINVLENKIAGVEKSLSEKIDNVEKNLTNVIDLVSDRVKTNAHILGELMVDNCKINERLDKIERSTQLLPQMYLHIGKTMLRVDKLEEEMAYVKRKVD